MDHSHDKKFFATFGMVMGALFAIFFICIAAARILTGAGDAPVPDDAAKARIEDRIKPIGQAVTDPAMLLKVAANKPARAPYTGEQQVVAKVCSACHGTGMLGAPKIGDHADWGKRKSAEGGIAGLLAAAIKGKGSMPARGGDPDLSDDELKAAIELMSK